MNSGKKCGKSRFISFLSLIVAAALIGVLTIISVSGENSSEPTMFAGDEPWYVESKNKWSSILGNVYVPVTIFQKFGIEIRTSTKSITITAGEKYISFSTVRDDNNERAYSPEKKEFHLNTYWLAHSVLGVPAKYVCDYFGLKFETYPAGNEANAKAVRIYSGASKYTLPDLLKIYNDTLLPPPLTSAPETTGPAVTPARAYLIYLTFEDAPNQNTDAILDVLDEYGYKATFFLNGDALEDYAGTVRRIIASGHSVGLHTMTRNSRHFARDIINFIDELREENALLHRLFRITSRLIRAPDGSRTSTFVINAEESRQIEELGYVIWDFNVDTYDTWGYSAKRVADNAINGIAKYGVPVLRFHSSTAAVKALPIVLDYIKDHSDQFSVAAITPAAENISFAG